MAKEGLWITDPETGEARLLYYDELDEEARKILGQPIGGFCFPAGVFSQLKLPSTPFYIRDWLPRQGKAIIYAPAKAGKSYLSIQIARHIGIGEAIFGIPVNQGRVLYIQFELGAEVLQARFKSTGFDYDNVYVGTHFSLKLDKTAGQKYLEQAIDAIEPNVLILDPLYKAITGDENESSDMAKVCDYLDSLIEAFGISILVIHHSGKDPSRGGRGSSILEDWVDSLIELKKTSHAGESLKVKVAPRLLRHAELPPEAIEVVMDNYEFRLANEPSPEDIVIAHARKHGSVLPKDLLEQVSNTTLYKTLADLCKCGVLKKSGRGEYKLC